MATTSSLASLTSVALSLIFLGTATPASSQERLLVGVYGGDWGKTYQQCVIDKFTKDTGIEVKAEPGTSGVTLSKLRQQAAQPILDIAFMDGGVSELAVGDNLTAEITLAQVPAISEIVPQAIYRNSENKIHALTTAFVALGLVYNTEAIKQAPTSWFDLWKPEYQGRVVLASLNHASGLPFLLQIAKLTGGSIESTDKAIDKIRQLKVALFADSQGQIANALQSGEAIIGVSSNAAWALTEQGLPIALAAPQEGAPASGTRIHVVRGTRREAAAYKFVQHAISKDAQECIADTLFVGPVRRDAQLSEKAAQRMPWGKGGSVDNLIFFDWNHINKRRAALTQTWNERIGNR